MSDILNRIDVTSARSSLMERLSAGERVSPEERQAVDAASLTQDNEFVKGLRRFGYSAINTTKAFTGQMLEPVAPTTGRGLINEAQESMRQMPTSLRPNYETWEQAKQDGLGGIGSYVASSLGEGLPSVGVALAGGLVGRGAAALLGRSAALGQGIGGIASMLPMEGGETALQLNDDPTAMANTTPLQRAGLSLGRGTVNAALENVVPQMMLAPRLLGQAARVAPGFGNAVRNVAAIGAEGALGEYGTEFAQDLTGQAVQRYANPATQWDLGQAHEAGIKGGIVGGLTGGLAGGAQSLYSYAGNTADQVADATKEKSGEFADVLRRTLGSGVDKGIDVVGAFKGNVDKFIASRIEDPAKREAYIDATSRLSTMTSAEFEILRNALDSDTDGSFTKALGAVAGSLTKRASDAAVEGGKALFQKVLSPWREASAGDSVAAAADPNGGKQSLQVRQFGETDRKDLMKVLNTFYPEVTKQLGKGTINERRQLQDVLLSAAQDSSYFNDVENNPLKQQVLRGWEEETGTDLRSVLEAVRDTDTVAKTRQLTKPVVDSFLQRFGLDGLTENKLHYAARSNSFDELSEPQRAMFESIAGKENAPAVFERFSTEYNSALQQGEDKSGLKTFNWDNVLEVGDGNVNVGAASQEGVGLAEEKNGAAFSEGEVMGIDKPDYSPFGPDAIQNSLVDENYRRKRGAQEDDPDTGVDVTLSAEGVPPSVLARAFGRRFGKEDFRPFNDGEVTDDQPLKLRLNPMSLSNMTKMEQFREAFNEDVGEYREGVSDDVRAGDRLISAMSTLADRGIVVNPEQLGLPAGEPIRVSVDFDPEQLKNPNLIIRRTGSSKDGTLSQYRMKDYTGQSRREVSVEAMNRALDRIEGEYRGSLQAYLDDNKNDPTAARIQQAVYSRARREYRIKPGQEPTEQQLEEQFAVYNKELFGKLESKQQREREGHLADVVREGYTGENFTRGDVEAFAKYLETGEMTDEATAVLDAIGETEVSPSRKLAMRLREMLDSVDEGREQGEKIITGQGDTATDATQEEFNAREATALERANNEVLAAQVRDAKRGTGGNYLRKREARRQAKILAEKNAELEQKMITSINEAPTKIRLAQIGKRIGELKKTLPQEMLDRVREVYEKKQAELQRKFNDAFAEFDDPKETPSGKASMDQGDNRQEEEAAQQMSDEDVERQAAEAKQGLNSANAKAAALTSAQRKFVDAVEKLLGKRVAIKFGEKLVGNASATYQTIDEALARVREERRAALEAGDKDAQAKAEARERELLEDKGILGVIRVATGREQIAGLAEHEAFHGAFSFFFTHEERRTLATAFSQGLVLKRLLKAFEGQPEVQKAIREDAEEAAAYGFQLWMRDPTILNPGGKVEGLFNKFLAFLRKLAGILTPEERAALILQDLASGARAERGTSPVAKVLDKDRPMTERAQDMVQKLGKVFMSGYDVLLTPVYQRLVQTENPALTALAKLGYQATGEDGNRGGMIQRAMHENKFWRNKLDPIFRGLDEKEVAALHEAKINSTRPTDAKLAERYDQLTKWYKDMRQYSLKAGVNMKDAGVNEDYYPLTWDPEKVLKNKAEFLAMLSKYEKQMSQTKKTPDEIWETITQYLDRGEDLVNVMGKDNEPMNEHARARSLWFLTKEDRRPFMMDDPMHVAAHYAKQAVRQAEFVRSYGNNGVKLQQMLYEAEKTYGATPDQISLARDYIDGLLGNKGIGMSRELKDVYGAMTVYQNYRLLPFSLFSSLVDPLGIAVRSNSIGDAWETFSYSIKNLFNEWKKDYTPDQWEKIAEDMGIIENAGTTINVHNLYDGITLRGTTKDLNDKLFKYNLLNGWIRNNTIMAVKAAHRFMYRAATGGVFSEKDSARYLEELGVSKDDIVYDKAQDRILVTKAELMAAGKSADEAEAIADRLRSATEKFVRQSLLSPSSAELPNWASNPYLAPLAHLKQFVFAFSSTIISRLEHEAKNQNYKPALIAAGYVPGIIAADFLKDMVSNFGEEPPYKKDWGVLDYLKNGVDRSGLTGVGQFITGVSEDMSRGGSGLESFAGPTLRQMQQGAQVLASDDPGKAWNWTVKALPLNPAYDQWLLNEKQ